MSDVEKLRALLAEARDLIAANRLVLGEHQGVREVQQIERRIYAALAEPVDDALEWQTAVTKALSESQERLAAEVREAIRERDEARAALSALCAEFEGAVANADWRAAGSKGMSVPFTGDFASAVQLPSVVSRMRWWAREMRKALGKDKP
jgi:hypothetical protein